MRDPKLYNQVIEVLNKNEDLFVLMQEVSSLFEPVMFQDVKGFSFSPMHILK